MNIPLLTVNDFLKTIRKNNIPIENNETDILKIKIDNLKTRLNNKHLLELINDLVPELKEENQYSLLLWTRMAFHLRAKYNINTNEIVEKYYLWRDKQGKSYTHVYSKESEKYIDINDFIKKSITKDNSIDFHKEWFCIKRPQLNNKKDFPATYGSGRINNVIFCLEEAIKNKTIDFLEKTKETNGKEYISYASREKLYDALKSKHNLLPKKSTFMGIASKLVINKYKGK